MGKQQIKVVKWAEIQMEIVSRTLTIKQWNNLENSKEFHGHHRCHEQKPLSVKDKKLASF